MKSRAPVKNLNGSGNKAINVKKVFIIVFILAFFTFVFPVSLIPDFYNKILFLYAKKTVTIFKNKKNYYFGFESKYFVTNAHLTRSKTTVCCIPV